MITDLNVPRRQPCTRQIHSSAGFEILAEAVVVAGMDAFVPVNR